MRFIIIETVLVIWAPFWFIPVIVWLLWWNSKLQYTIMAFSASSFRATEEDWLSETDLSGPHSFLWMFLLLLKELISIFLSALFPHFNAVCCIGMLKYSFCVCFNRWRKPEKSADKRVRDFVSYEYNKLGQITQV